MSIWPTQVFTPEHISVKLFLEEMSNCCILTEKAEQCYLGRKRKQMALDGGQILPFLHTTVLSLSKVADCICLMALDKPQAVPVDVHVWQIAQRDYGWQPNTSQAKSPSPLANKELGEENV